MPHSTVRIYQPWIRNNFGNGKVDIVGIAYPHSDAAISGESAMNLKNKSHEFILVDLKDQCGYYTDVRCLLITSKNYEETVRLTAFCPKTVHKIPSDAFARHARIMYVGSINFTSAGMPISLNHLFV